MDRSLGMTPRTVILEVEIPRCRMLVAKIVGGACAAVISACWKAMKATSRWMARGVRVRTAECRGARS
jgi:hypothetical protein